jgi:hypothetical protein
MTRKIGFKLIGHKNPFGHYPNMVIPVGELSNGEMVAFISDGTKMVRVDSEWNFVEHDENLRHELVAFDYSKDGLFAFDRHLVERYRFKEEKQFLKEKLNDLKFSDSDPFFRLALAEITNDTATIIREILASLLFVNNSFRNENPVAHWYQNHLDALVYENLDFIKLPKKLTFLPIQGDGETRINLVNYLLELKSLNAKTENLNISIDGAIQISRGFLKEKEFNENLFDVGIFYRNIANMATVGTVLVGEGASDLTQAEDKKIMSDRMADVSDVVGAAGIVDVAEGVEMIMKGGNVKAMGAIISMMSREELERGLRLAHLAGELKTVSEVVAVLDLPVLAEFLMEMSESLQDIASDQLLRFTSTRALAGTIKGEGKGIEERGENEAAEGMVRLAVSKSAAERSKELSQASDALAARGVDELLTAKAAITGIAKVAEGSDEIGKGEALEATSEALEERSSL